MKTRNEEIFEMYNKYISMKEIGIKYGISKQRVWQIIKHNFDKKIPRKFMVRDCCTVVRSTPSENFVYKKLNELKIKYKPTGMGEYYDVLIGDKKVEIKYRSKVIKNFYRFNQLIPRHPIDYYIFVCGELKETVKFYIYPAKKIKNNFNIQLIHIYKNKPKNYKYLDNWEVFK